MGAASVSSAPLVFNDPGLRDYYCGGGGVCAIYEQVSAYVYILASGRYGTLYTGCTTDLPKRMWEHREGVVPGFTATYDIKRLVWFEEYHDVSDAIVREQRIKDWQRDWKVRLIEEGNVDWDNLAVTILGFNPLPPKKR